MMPMPQQGGPMGQPQQGQPNPEEIKRKLVELLVQVKQMAEQNGIDFAELLSAVSGGGGSRPSSPMPPAPATL